MEQLTITRRRLVTGFFLLSLCCVVLLWRPTQAQKASPVETERAGNKQRTQPDTNSEIEKLRAEIRQLKAELAEQRRQMNELEKHLTVMPEVEIQPEDYAQVRSRFQTKLLRKGPTTQQWPPVKPPAGVTEIEYASGELRLKAWINRPPNHRLDERRKQPAVLYLHGGFYFASGAWEQTKPYRDAGFIVLAPLLRAENGQPGAWSYFYDEVDDVLAAAEYLGQQPYVDASRLFVAGHSNGGTLALLAAQASRRFRAAASFDGSPYRPDFVNHPESLPFDRSDPREIQLRSPIAYAGSFKCPVRLYHSSLNLARLMNQRTAALARMRGLDVAAVAIEGDHVTHVPEAMRQSIAFFLALSAR
jgi:dienelactone hydrolase/cell division protein FtsB